ncbi:polyketide cyclase/dehydrase [Neokomagataea thailandica NBRC 106555]|nr:polyketide cyclase/dehydrase [Neokomagataea thailandica NBRC 106555]
MEGLIVANLLSLQRKIETQIEIRASPERVWSVLTEIMAYPSWNPFIRELTGRLVVGQKLRIRLSGGIVFKPKVITVQPRQRLQWIGRLWGVPGVFTGVHDFEIMRTQQGSLLRQSEAFYGMMLWFYDVEKVRAEFTKMNEALKTRAEIP